MDPKNKNAYRIDIHTQRLKVLLALGIKSYGTAGVHARESHFPGVFTVKRLQAGRKEMRKERDLVRFRTQPVIPDPVEELQRLFEEHKKTDDSSN